MIALIQILITWYLFFNKKLFNTNYNNSNYFCLSGNNLNSVHTQMHGMPSVDYNIGYPSLIPFEYLSFKIIMLNIITLKEQNILMLLPIADYIFKHFNLYSKNGVIYNIIVNNIIFKLQIILKIIVQQHMQ